MAATTEFGKAVLASVSSVVNNDLPKFELHAHINGSIPIGILQRFAQEDLDKEKKASSSASAGGDSDDSATTTSAAQRVADDVRCFMTPLGPEATPSERMAHCFKVFDVVYKLMQTRQRLWEATRAVVRSFMDEGCIYVELRTTPKSLPDGTNDEQYVACVLDAINAEINDDSSSSEKKNKNKNKMVCNLLLSINRRGAPESALRVIDLAVMFRERLALLQNQNQSQQQQEEGGSSSSSADSKRSTASNFVSRVVGIDFCGDCYARTFKEFLPALEKAKANHLPVTVHMGEKQDDEEVDQMVSFGPHRVGHCVFINQRAHEALRVRQVPLEICITSNMLTGGLERPKDHHITEWMRGGKHPVTINTDDFGVFQTTLVQELMLFAEICLELWLEANNNDSNDNGKKLDGDADDEEKRKKNAAAKWICSELWRVQFHAARSAFCYTEGERGLLLEELGQSHEKVWKEQKWW